MPYNRELGDDIVTFSDDESNEAVEICYILYIVLHELDILIYATFYNEMVNTVYFFMTI